MSEAAVSRTIKGVIPVLGEFSSLSQAEIERLEKIIEECVPELNRSLRRYKFQYLPYVNPKGDKLVWVNAFCSKEAHWKEEILIVMDGGDCYLKLTINLSKGECETLIINGEA